jgi:hypothetical protein
MIPRAPLLVAAALGLATAAWADDQGPLFAPVTSQAGEATVDWTHMRLTMAEQAQPAPGSHAELQVVEQQARGRLGPRVLEAAGQVRLDHETTAGDLIASRSSLGEHLGQESSSWHVSEARYHSSGRVEITAELDLATWLRPVAYAGAHSGDPPQGERSRFTGILVDARGLDAEGALAPRLLSAEGDVLFSVERVHEAVARKRSIVQYVSDPADPLAYGRAGDNPLLLRALDVRDDVDLVLTVDDTTRLRTVSRDAYLLTEALVVLVLDP